jgi:hypothetical protein
MRKGIGDDRSKDGRYARRPVPGLRRPRPPACAPPVPCLRPGFVPAARSGAIALPDAGFVPYAGAVPDGGRHGFEAAETVASPHRLAA